MAGAREGVWRVDVLYLDRDGMVLDVAGVCEGAFTILVDIVITAIRVIRVGVGHVQDRGSVGGRWGKRNKSRPEAD